MDEVKAVKDYSDTKTMDKDAAIAAGLYQTIGADIDDPYIAELKKLVIHQDAIDAVGGELKIVYTPLHGTGNIPVRRVLKSWASPTSMWFRSRNFRWGTSHRQLSEPGGGGGLRAGTGSGKEGGCGPDSRHRS